MDAAILRRRGGESVRKRKSWREKLADSKDLPKVVTITGKMIKRYGSGTVAIPAPREVEAIMRRVPRGKIITINGIRNLVAKKHGGGGGMRGGFPQTRRDLGLRHRCSGQRTDASFLVRTG